MKKLDLRHIKSFITDVDGVLNNGKLHYTPSGIHIKSFHVHDGYGLKLLLASGINVAVITSCTSEIITKRFSDLGVEYLYKGQNNKIKAYEDFHQKLSLDPQETVYIGDDLPDLPLIERSGVGIAVSDANEVVKQAADWITTNRGGAGAVREICDVILQQQNRLITAFEALQREN